MSKHRLAVGSQAYFARECCPLRLYQAGQLSFQYALHTSIGGTPLKNFPLRVVRIYYMLPFLRNSMTLFKKAVEKRIFFIIAGSEAIWVRKTNDSSKIRIFLTQLAKGKFVLKRRAV
jgi:hypothetical protein